MLAIPLERPLAVIDIESTGINPRLDRIIDLAIVKQFPDGRVETRTFRVNPEIPIPAEVTAIHHIRDQDVMDCPPFRKVAADVAAVLADCDLGGFGVAKFDLPLLCEEMTRAGIEFKEDDIRVLDAQRVFHKKEPRDLTAALAFYCNEPHAGAHGAEADALATLKVLEAQLLRYPDLPKTVDELDRYCHAPKNRSWVDKAGRLKWVNGEVVINFGAQNIGRRLQDMAENNPKFLVWILKSDFPSDTKRIVADALDGHYPQPQPQTEAVPPPE